MNDKEIFDNYNVYVKGLTTQELESICGDIDREQYQERYAIICKELKRRSEAQDPPPKRSETELDEEDTYIGKIVGIIIFLALIVFELYIEDEKFLESFIPQISRLALITSLAFLCAIFTRGRNTQI